MEKIMMDGEPLEVGDRVYSVKHGWGRLYEIEDTQEWCKPMWITFEINGRLGYTLDFKYYPHDEDRSLYWQKPEITPPPKIKPKKKIKVADYFVEWPSGAITRANEVRNVGNLGGLLFAQKIDGTEREIEVEE